MKSEDQRLLDEKKFHDNIFSSRARTKVSKFYSINSSIEKAFNAEIFKNPYNKTILEYGCGMGNKLLELDKLGARTFGIDISDFAIKELSMEANKVGSKTSYYVMNAENLEFEDNFFDVIYGSGILHHLDLEKSFKTISDKLKPEGAGLFIEPLGHNPLINNFRNKTPDIRTEDEHPLLIEDFSLARKYFKKIEVKYFYLSTLALPVLFGKNIPSFLINFCNVIDNAIFTLLPFMRRYAWQVLIKLESPRK